MCIRDRFAEALLEEIRGKEHPVIFVQDYHFALLPRMIKDARPDARVALFWHIPWPNPESFSICPWQAELVNGLLGADVLGFHLQAHCNNFFQTVDRVLEARTDWEHFTIRRNGHVSAVRPYPISVAWDGTDSANPEGDRNGSGSNGSMTERDLFKIYAGKKEELVNIGSFNGCGDEGDDLRRELGIEGKQLVLGVDRMDYTKGIVERLLAIEMCIRDSYGCVDVSAGAESSHMEIDEPHHDEGEGGRRQSGAPIVDTEVLKEEHGAPIVEGGLFKPGVTVEIGRDAGSETVAQRVGLSLIHI